MTTFLVVEPGASAGAMLPSTTTCAPATGLPPRVTLPLTVPLPIVWNWLRASVIDATEPSPTTNQRSIVTLSPGLPLAASGKFGPPSRPTSASATERPSSETVTPDVLKVELPGTSCT